MTLRSHSVRTLLTSAAAFAAVAALAPPAAFAQAAPAAATTWPERPITLVVPYTPGGQFDTHARLIAKSLTGLLNQSVVVENKPGAGTTLGAEYVARAKPDGYTLLMAGATMFTIAPHTFAQLRYKVEDFQTVSLLNELPMALIVNPQTMPVKNFREFVAYAKANPGKVDYATTGPGVATHLLGELTEAEVGIDINPVHYKGTGQAIVDLAAGRVPATFDGYLAHAPMLKEGKTLALGISSEKRLPGAPNIPTFAEQGYPALSMSSWAGIVVPRGTPAPIVDKLQKAVAAAIRSDEVNARMVADATVPLSSTPAEFDALIKRDYQVWGGLIKKLGGVKVQ